MEKVLIDRFRIVPAERTGIGWVAVEKHDSNNYVHVATFRSENEAKTFIRKENANGK